MQEPQTIPYPLLPFSANIAFDNQPPARKISSENVDCFDNGVKCPIRAIQTRAGGNRQSNRRKENSKTPLLVADPVKSINKIISDCEEAVHQYTTDNDRGTRASRSHSFKFSNQVNVFNTKCACRGSSKIRDPKSMLATDPCIEENCVDENAGMKRDVRKSLAKPAPTRKKSLKMM